MDEELTIDDVEPSPRPWELTQDIEESLSLNFNDFFDPSFGYWIGDPDRYDSVWTEVASINTDYSGVYDRLHDWKRDRLIALKNAEHIVWCVNHHEELLKAAYFASANLKRIYANIFVPSHVAVQIYEVLESLTNVLMTADKDAQE